MAKRPTPRHTLPRRSPLKQFGPLWVQTFSAVDRRSGASRTYDFVWVKDHRTGRLVFNHVYEQAADDVVERTPAIGAEKWELQEPGR